MIPLLVSTCVVECLFVYAPVSTKNSLKPERYILDTICATSWLFYLLYTVSFLNFVRAYINLSAPKFGDILHLQCFHFYRSDHGKTNFSINFVWIRSSRKISHTIYIFSILVKALIQMIKNAKLHIVSATTILLLYLNIHNYVICTEMINEGINAEKFGAWSLKK